MRFFGRALAIGLLFAAQALVMAIAGDIDRTRFNPILGSILKVEVMTANGGYSLGTAVSVAPGKFVTSCHVTAPASKVAVLYDGVRWPAESQSSDLEHDACLLAVPGLSKVEAVRRRSARDMHVGQDVVAIGYTFGAGLLAQSGKISALHPFDGSVVIQTTTPFNSGASGGGLFDADGALIGILTFRLPGADSFYFSIPAEWIDARIDNTDNYKPVAPLEGARPFWARPKESLPYFMKATTLEAARDWEGLIKLTDEWTVSDDHNSEPWLIRGQAYSQIDRSDAAIKSFRSAIKRDPKLALAWFGLGETYARRGSHDEVVDALAHLRPLDPELADDLAVRGGIGTQP